MINLEFLHTGYTPELFTKIMWERGLKREDVAEYLLSDRTSSDRTKLETIHRWAASLDRPTHQDMPLEKWRKFLAWAATKPILKSISTVDISNKLAAYLNADLQSTNLSAVIAEIPLQYKSDISEYLEQGLEQAIIPDNNKWEEILNSELMQFKAVLSLLAIKAPSADILEKIFAAEPESDSVLRSIGRNPNCSENLRNKCITQLRQNHRDSALGRDFAGSDYSLLWQVAC